MYGKLAYGQSTYGNSTVLVFHTSYSAPLPINTLVDSSSVDTKSIDSVVSEKIATTIGTSSPTTASTDSAVGINILSQILQAVETTATAINSEIIYTVCSPQSANVTTKTRVIDWQELSHITPTYGAMEYGMSGWGQDEGSFTLILTHGNIVSATIKTLLSQVDTVSISESTIEQISSVVSESSVDTVSTSPSSQSTVIATISGSTETTATIFDALTTKVQTKDLTPSLTTASIDTATTVPINVLLYRLGGRTEGLVENTNDIILLVASENDILVNETENRAD